jgi:hypothetical protein
MWKPCFLAILTILGTSLAQAEEPAPVLASFNDEIEKVFSLRNMGQVELTNLRGAIYVQGWALDKIKVKARRTVQAPNAEEAKKLFALMDFRFRTSGDDVELSAEYGKGLDIKDRLKERGNPQTNMDITVFAPSRLKLRVWASTGAVSVKSWVGALEVRTSSGAIHVEDVRTDKISLLCPSCNISAKEVRGSIRCMGGTGKVDLSDVEGKEVYVETAAGSLNLNRIKGDQLYVSKEGWIVAKNLRGRIEFHTENGAVDIRDGYGFVSGHAETGNIYVQMREWHFLDKALVESIKGNVEVALPPKFSGEVDLWSVQGKAALDFKLQALQDAKTFGPDPLNHLRGKINEGGEQLRVFSQGGNVKISRTTGI